MRHPRSRHVVVAALVCAAVLHGAASGQAQDPAGFGAPKEHLTPGDADNLRLSAEVVRAGRSPAAIVPLLLLWENWDRSTPSRLMRELERLARDARLSPATRVLVETMLAQGRLRLGEPDAVHRRFEELGYVTRVRVIGPFDNEGKRGFDQETPVEAARMQAPDLLASYPGRERQVSWRELPDVVRSGFVSMGAVMRPHENVCGLAETFVHSDRARALSLWVGAGGAVKVYWNGELVLRDDAYRFPSPDRSVAMVGAHRGANRLLVKVCTSHMPLGFQLRIGDEQGGLVKGGLSYTLDDKGALDIPGGHGVRKLPKAPVTALAHFEAQARAEKPSAKMLADFARYLMLTGSDDPAERRAKQLAEQAAELDPSPAHLLLAAQLAEQRAEVMRFADRALALHPEQADVLLLQATTLASGPAPEAALPWLARVPEDAPAFARAAIVRARILRNLELPATALSHARRADQLTGRTPELLRTLAELESEVGRVTEALALRKELLALRFDDPEARRVLVEDALQRGAISEVLEHADALRALMPASIRTLLFTASLYDAIGRGDLELAAYREALALSPEADNVYSAYGRALLRVEQDQAAAELLNAALQLRPQDAETRALLEEIRPKQRKDEGYAVSTEQLLARRHADRGYPFSVLHDLTVKTVFDSGLGTKFRQLAVQVHDKEGARRFRTHAFQYDPTTQHVDLRLARVHRKDGRVLESVRTFEEQLGEPWYRLYYDTRAVVIVFPDLEPGDVVEVRYRVDDVAQRNLFSDYFGDLHPFQELVPKQHSEYVLITPTSREIFANTPSFPGLSHTRSVEGDLRIDRYLAKNLPALVTEDGTPGLTEQSPYLHVSTYRSWQEVGRWYWGLIKDQLYADQKLKRKVAELLAGAKTTGEKVQRIHQFTVENTRYVGLEFGIHGFLPYRVPLIVQRGFGDCKDKASLMYTMLREAGIDARIALVRTRRNGAIETAPASLAAFDHAITYVPELDLYLDGTAEHSGTRELPTEDQGVMVLLVGPDGSELRTTPVLSADDNLRKRELHVQLAADGSARIEGREQVSGFEAAGYRDYYQALGTRGDRLERTLSTLFPGVRLESQRFDDLHDREVPVRFEYRARAPHVGRWDGAELWLAPSALVDLVRTMARTPLRAHPLQLASAFAYVEERTIAWPSTLHAASVPEDAEVSSPFGSLRLRYETKKDSVKVRAEFRLHKARIETSEYPAFRRFVEEADQLLRARIGLRRGES